MPELAPDPKFFFAATRRYWMANSYTGLGQTEQSPRSIRFAVETGGWSGMRAARTTRRHSLVGRNPPDFPYLNAH